MKPIFEKDECYKLYLSDNYDDSNRDLNAEIFTFPGGEPHVKITLRDGGKSMEDFHNLPIRIYHTIKSFNDLGVLFAAVDALRRSHTWKLSLVLPYFPGARQDRIAADLCEPLTVKVYADLINSLDFAEVIIFDPHSDVAPALIKNCVVLNNHIFADGAAYYAVKEDGDAIFVCPDAGAVKKMESFLYYINDIWREGDQSLPDILYCRKHRDMATGKLSSFTIDNPVDLKGVECVVIDDICDGGKTFVEIGKLLKAQNAGDLHLVISHGIFSAGFEALLEQYKTISTSNSWASDLMFYPESVGSAAAPKDRVFLYDIVRTYNL